VVKQVITAILVLLKKPVVTKENELESGKSYVENRLGNAFPLLGV